MSELSELSKFDIVDERDESNALRKWIDCYIRPMSLMVKFSKEVKFQNIDVPSVCDQHDLIRYGILRTYTYCEKNEKTKKRPLKIIILQ